MEFTASMSRRHFLGSIGAAASLAAFRSDVLFGQDRPATMTKELRRGVGYFVGRGGTIGWLVNKDALVAVDTQMPGTAEIALEELGKMSPRKIDLLINSHHHYDHTGGNGIFKPKTNRILAHKRVPDLQRVAAEKSNRLDGQVYADTTFGHEWRENLGDETIALRYWGPAHTGGDAIIHFEKANVVHTGDLVFNRMAPYIDTFGGASVENWVNVLDAMLKQFDTDTQYIFGHGNEAYGILGKKEDVEAMQAFLAALFDYTQKGFKAGKSADELASIDALPGFEIYAEGNTKSRFQGGIKEVYAQLKGS